ncbi:hypothetical protein [Phormidesmis sp. 146-33]
MSVLESCSELQDLLNQTFDFWGETRAKADRLQSVGLDNLSPDVQCVIENCNEVVRQLVAVLNVADSIQSSVGVYNFLASTGLISTVVIPLTSTAYDASVVYDPDPTIRLSDLKDNPVPDRYKNSKNKVLGDLGEITVLKMLVDPEGEDRLTEQEIELIQIKPSLQSKISSNEQNPDFYIPSRNVVIDAKAWKKVKTCNLQKVIKKYENLECMAQGGEVRLYFPSDTYENGRLLLKNLHTHVDGVRIRIVPMQATYRDLTWQRELVYLFFKCSVFLKPRNK